MRAPDVEFIRASRGARTFPGVADENYWFRRHQAAYRVAARLLATRGAGPVLEAGCGEGYGADLLRREGRVQVVAMDLDAGAAAHAARAHSAGPVLRADACRLPFRPGSFSAVVAFQILEHLYCPGEFVETAGVLLRPGGVLLVATPNRETSDDGNPNPFHVHEYTGGELGGLLGARFERVRLGGIHAGPLLRALDRPAGGSLQHRLARTPFAELPPGLRLAARAVRAGHFQLGQPSGSLDLLAVAERPGRRR
ncbi:MAG: class I SAM-dependent methyltransferase [Actinomycetota bacterium]|nr:class I SAM-dependent methyltransferase [Actinomycetota bacterium]